MFAAPQSILLYKFEKKQHRELKEKSGGGSAEPVSIYGAEHLLRLFVKMPELLARCAIPREHVTVLISKLSVRARCRRRRVASAAADAAADALPQQTLLLTVHNNVTPPHPPLPRLPSQELLKFLMNNKAKYFAAEYQCPDELYLNWWQSDENKSSDK